jgi:hypothetical protein
MRGARHAGKIGHRFRGWIGGAAGEGKQRIKTKKHGAFGGRPPLRGGGQNRDCQGTAAGFSPNFSAFAGADSIM